MPDMPERIWAGIFGGSMQARWSERDDQLDLTTEYIRADEYERLRAALEEALSHAWNRTLTLGTYCNWCHASETFDRGVEDIPHKEGCRLNIAREALEGKGRFDDQAI